jgi:hypothetical protein
MGITRCAICSAIRPPNASFCPNCGSAYGSPPDLLGGAIPPRIEVDLSLWTCVKIGIGVTLGSAIVGLFALLLIGFLFRLNNPAF